jgi:hypothetical protein
MDMLFLNLPEKILLWCKEHKNKYLIGLMIHFNFTAETKGCYDDNHIPTIGTFIPADL